MSIYRIPLVLPNSIYIFAYRFFSTFVATITSIWTLSNKTRLVARYFLRWSKKLSRRRAVVFVAVKFSCSRVCLPVKHREVLELSAGPTSWLHLFLQKQRRPEKTTSQDIKRIHLGWRGAADVLREWLCDSCFPSTGHHSPSLPSATHNTSRRHSLFFLFAGWNVISAVTMPLCYQSPFLLALIIKHGTRLHAPQSQLIPV